MGFRSALAGLSTLVLSLITGPLLAQEPDPEKIGLIKAAVVYNIAKMVTWPEEQEIKNGGSFFRICFVGTGNLKNLAESIHGKAIRDGYIEAVAMGSTDDLLSCRVIYINVRRPARLLRALDKAATTSILTIGDSADFLEQGGMIRLFIENQQLRYSVNQLAMTNQGLSVEQIIALAAEVID